MRNEWTEWHLTPGGWQKGSTRVHGQGNTWADEPEDRVLSFVYKELTGSAGGTKASLEESWRSKTAPNIDDLLKEHGPGPRQL